MRWERAHVAEVIRGFDEAASEMIMPDAVHNGAACEHVLGIGDPFRQGGAPRSFLGRIEASKGRVGAGHAGDSGRGNQLAGPFHVARSEEHTSELQSHSFISYAVFC